MSQLIWLTPPGLINKIPEEEYYEFQLDAYNTNGGDLKFTIIAGKLPGGLQLFRSGLIQGIPIIEKISGTAPEFTFKFTVRATTTAGKVSDRTFSLTINSIALPQIVPKNVSLGTVFDGEYLDLQLIALDPHPLTPLTWEITSGSLPNGTTMSSDGRITGYVLPSYVDNPNVRLGWGTTGWDYVSWDQSTLTSQTLTYRFTVDVYDGSRRDNAMYTMLVQAKGLYTADNTLIDISGTNILASTDNSHNPFITTLPQSLPTQRQLTNFAFKVDGIDLDGDVLEYHLITSDADTYDASPFDSVGFENVDYSVPDLVIDPVTGWLSGVMPAQVEDVKTYTFQVECFKRDYSIVRSEPVTFKLTILGDTGNIITWVTPANLGEIVNGEISSLRIAAASTRNKVLNYRIQEGSPNPPNILPSDEVITYTPNNASKLPQGLKLLPNGLIVGRSTFEYFSLDGGTTTLDSSTTSYDRTFTFTVTASDGEYYFYADSKTGNTVIVYHFDELPEKIVSENLFLAANPTVISSKTFTVKVRNVNKAPYENLYLRAFLPKTKMDDFNALMSNPDIFPAELIYRAEDPWYGKATQVKVLFASGLTASNVETYANTVHTSHYNKFVDFKDIKTAVALDENFNPIYEVVYVEVIDNLTVNGKSISRVMDRSSEVKGIYTNAPYNIVYPNSFDNMKENVVYFTHYTNRGALPDWMLDQQENGRILGFTRGFILAYTVPGASKLIAYRLLHSGFSFNNLDFLADRYQLDNYLSKNYSIPDTAFIPSLETTFDRLPPAGGPHPYAGAVDIAVMLPFDEINGRTLDYLTRKGGINGTMPLREGMTLVFAKQENFTNVFEQSTVTDVYDTSNYDALSFNASIVAPEYNSPNNGWNIELSIYDSERYAQGSYTGRYPYYDNVDDGYFDPTFYDDAKYDRAAVVPGYLESIMNPAVFNERGGIWKVTITSENVVILEPVIRYNAAGNRMSTVQPNEYVQVSANSKIYGGCKIFYDTVAKPGNTMPEYSLLTIKNMTMQESTYFDGGKTRFFNNVDMYAPPETDDKYLKFPKTNIYV
jgi:hypothetical protein